MTLISYIKIFLTLLKMKNTLPLPAPKEILCSQNPESEFKCSYCNTSFLTSDDLLHHNSVYEYSVTSIPTGIETPIPVKIFSNVEKPTLITGSEIKAIECHECLRLFSSEKGLNQHVGKVHNFNRRSVKCHLCIKKFREGSALKFHIRQVHDKTTRVKCDDCQKVFYSKYVLLKHRNKCLMKMRSEI
ncbi:unnamed protein product [Blepharisma stoltei]|uniref:C2H2-type domain-containing protein n=1 Tax=Blepharisma stoltei TaxID=1481888 RepID=A0AAU9IZE8_9CILI|nr:unnamed protein product [Blepharisma stoltei]